MNDITKLSNDELLRALNPQQPASASTLSDEQLMQALQQSQPAVPADRVSGVFDTAKQSATMSGAVQSGNMDNARQDLRERMALADAGRGAGGAALRGATSGGTLSAVDDVVAGIAGFGGLAEGLLRGEGWSGASQRSHRAQANIEAGAARANARDWEENPFARLGGELVGAVAAPVGPLGQIKSVGTLARIGEGALKGAALGGTQGFFAESGTLAERTDNALKGAAVGGVVGGAVPAVERGVKAIADVGRRVFKPGATADDLIAKAYAADRAAGAATMTADDVARATANGQPVMLADTGGEAVRRLADKAATKSDEAGALLKSATTERAAGQRDRLDTLFSRMFGDTDNLARRDALKEAARKANKPAYDAYRAATENGVWTDELASLMQSPTFRKAVAGAEARGAEAAVAQGGRPVVNPFIITETGEFTMKPGVMPTGAFWDVVKQNLDDVIGKGVREGANMSDLMAIRRKLIDGLDNATKLPDGRSLYANARGGAAKFFQAEDALDAGIKFATQTERNTPELLSKAKKVFSSMSPAEQQMFRDGFVQRVRDIMKDVGENRDLTKNALFNTDTGRSKLELVLGPKQARELETAIRVESTMQLLNKQLAGSQTAQRLVSQLGGGAALGGGAGWLTGGDSFPGAILGAALAGARGKIDARLAQKIGEKLASSDPKVVAGMIQNVARQPELLSRLRVATDAIERILVTQGSNAGVSSIPTLVVPNRAVRADDSREKR